jgi:hypothetical protein
MRKLQNFNYDNSWHYHLSKIDWDFFLSLRYKMQSYYGSSFQAPSHRREAIWKLFQDARRELGIPRNSIQWFASTEKNEDQGFHNHILVKARKDAGKDKNIILSTLYNKLCTDLFEKSKTRAGKILPESFQVVENNDSVVKYVLKTESVEEKVTGIKEWEFYSEKFVQLCPKLKIKGKNAW